MSRPPDLLRELYEASLEATVQQLRALYRSTRPPEAMGACRPPDGETAAGPTDLLYDLTRLTLQHYNELATLSARYTDQLVDRLRELGRGTTARRGATGPLAIRGVAGGTATTRFAIDNPGREPAEVGFATGEFRAGSGGPPFDARVTFRATDGEPADDRRLEAGHSRTFVMTVHLEHPFTGGERYTAELFVLLHGRLVERVPLEVRVDTAPGAVVRPA